MEVNCVGDTFEYENIVNGQYYEIMSMSIGDYFIGVIIKSHNNPTKKQQRADKYIWFCEQNE